MSKELQKFHRNNMVNANGELLVNAGRFSRGAVVMAYEMMGGLEAFTEWAEENKGDFYTKLFGKVIGREVEHNVSDSVEALLDQLDGGALDNHIIDVTPGEENVEYTEFEEVQAPSKLDGALLAMAERYAEGEPDDDEAYA